MNIRNLTSAAISTINPMVNCLLEMSTGNHLIKGGVRVPEYATVPNVPCRFQALSSGDLMKSDGLDIQGVHRAVYLDGTWEGINRSTIKGGDRIIDPQDRVWKVTQVLEPWREWTKLLVTLQST